MLGAAPASAPAPAATPTTPKLDAPKTGDAAKAVKKADSKATDAKKTDAKKADTKKAGAAKNDVKKAADKAAPKQDHSILSGLNMKA